MSQSGFGVGMGRLELGKEDIVKTVEMEPKVAEDGAKSTSRDGTRGDTPSSALGITMAEMVFNVRIWHKADSSGRLRKSPFLTLAV